MKKISTLLLVAGLTAGCSDKALDVQNVNVLTTDNYYKTEEDALKAVNAAYATLASPDLYSQVIHLTQELMSDETNATVSTSPSLILMRDAEADATNEVFNFVWSGCYQGVYRSNLAITRIPGVPMNEATKSRLLGEAYFLRAMYYFILVTNFGDVPLILKVVDVSKPEEKQPTRIAAANVYAAILKDFEEAEKRLPVSYEDDEIGRVTSGAAKGFRAKALLYRANLTNSQADYAASAKLFKEIIDSNVYDLVPNYRDNHTNTNENNRESLFEVQFSTTVDPGAFCDECGTGGLRPLEMGVRGRAYNNVIPSEWYVKQFETGDTRLLASVFGPQGSKFDGLDYYKVLEYKSWFDILPVDYAVRKYQKDAGNEFDWTTGSDVNIRLMRFADVLLMFAEATNSAQGPTADAYAAVNRVRKRAGLKELDPGLSKTAFMDWIMHERVVELGLEGHRWRDLVRWKKAYQELTSKGRPFDEKKHYLFPIPAKERQLNPNLTQNPGW
ncbi:RagB/SusD family nutrient uptake outer membrane protein [Larkinella rosea]|uniref:RagB/SusD family nutrient uptake outer membrane protein n=1 Tax=Larkinella rosea TaxID=2025312 RepID=A0A3P1BI24_9BACT|nr:RagB/SusD family nutrient uptake outer membrane protein [Larkinella rosea]RRB00730.1 RagB/SusD family nutrient uptake outer membrane protein [Larkinella rosea]